MPLVKKTFETSLEKQKTDNHHFFSFSNNFFYTVMDKFHYLGYLNISAKINAFDLENGV